MLVASLSISMMLIIYYQSMKKAWDDFNLKLEEDMEGNKKLFYKMTRNKRRTTEGSKSMEDVNRRKQ